MMVIIPHRYRYTTVALGTMAAPGTTQVPTDQGIMVAADTTGMVATATGGTVTVVTATGAVTAGKLIKYIA